MDRHYDYCPQCGGPKKKQSELCRGCKPSYHRDEAHRQKMSEIQKEHGPYRPAGWNHSVETRQKIASSWTPEKREAAKIRGLAFAADPEWRRKIGESVSGCRNPMWEDGRSEIPYAPGWGRVNRRLVNERANHRCENCGEQKPLDTHHRDGSKSNHAEDNLQALCRSCHKKAHSELRKLRMSLQD